jgi:hypothetical protein
MNVRPAVVSREDLVAILNDMADRVRVGDCFGGSIEFEYWDQENGAGKDEFSAMGAYRVGNLEGQGGMRIIRSGEKVKDENWDGRYDDQPYV